MCAKLEHLHEAVNDEKVIIGDQNVLRQKYEILMTANYPFE